MKKSALSLLTVVCLVIIMPARVNWAFEPEWQDLGNGYRNIRIILIDEKKPQNIYFGSDQGVFISTDSGKNWSNLLSLKGENRLVNSLAFGKDRFSLYAATGNGLFFSSNQGQSWKKIFQAGSSLGGDCQVLAVVDDYIYLGTKAGLFISPDSGKTWKKQLNVLGYSKITSIAVSRSDSEIYIASVEGLFKTHNNGQTWDKLFTCLSVGEEGQDDEFTAEVDEPEKFTVVNSVAIDPENKNSIYLAATSGIYQSADRGQTWQRLIDRGLPQRNVKEVKTRAGSGLFCATRRGVYSFSQGLWNDLSVRLISGEINGFTLDHSDNLYVSSSKGLFKLSGPGLISGPKEKEDENKSFLNEGPQISQVQLAAVKYAEVEPEKIRNWRKAAAKKAWLPEVNLGFNRDMADLWHWESGSTTKECDDVLRKGRDSLDWDINLSWELGDIIWSDDQNAIDVRSRLTVQLRNDILDEVTKLFFERLRVRAELEDLDILDKKKRQEKELRLREITAYLDGLTGGYFSSCLKK
jgi:photosystem II stability/assembly factor-like uncharacterized protein